MPPFKFSSEVINKIEDRVFAGLIEAGERVLQTGNDLIRSPSKSGHVYDTFFRTIGSGPGRIVIPYGKRDPHRASAPGEAPAIDSGHLVDSGRVIPDRPEMRVVVAWTAPYADYLQHGTDRMAPRPFATLALTEVIPTMPGIFGQVRPSGRAS